MAAESKQENAIVVDHVKKHFKVFLDKGQSFKERLLFRKRRRYENRQVLRDISFTVKRGEAVGLIGHNGCGKSTTLKLLTRILYPDSGTITIQGRVSSLIELGAGFHPDMSGRENIYTNASIFGLSKKEIDARLQTIIDFSELEPFIDNPVRTYSSGMYMRLAFSVAINVDADVLLIDEILGVGDVNFQAKCFQKLQEIKADGTTIVIVSHSMGQIEQICDRCIWIEDGLIKEEGIPKYVDEHYLSEMEQLRRGTRGGRTPERTSGKGDRLGTETGRQVRGCCRPGDPSPGRNSRRSAKNPQCAWGRDRYSSRMLPCWRQTARHSMCSAPETRLPCG
ncbi:MAG: ABC transporter ATP-binding protein [Ruminococcus sp.]